MRGDLPAAAASLREFFRTENDEIGGTIAEALAASIDHEEPEAVVLYALASDRAERLMRRTPKPGPAFYTATLAAKLLASFTPNDEPNNRRN